jgi:hypothetical protein
LIVVILKVGHLKKELKNRNDELSVLRQDYQKAIEAIERLRIECDTLRSTNKLNESHLKEVDKINNLNRNLSLEIDAMKKTVRFTEPFLNILD